MGNKEENIPESDKIHSAMEDTWEEHRQEEEYIAKLEARDPLRYFMDHSDNGPTGHGDICESDADPGL